MTSDPSAETPDESTVPQIDFTSIKTDGNDLVRRAGRKSLQATVFWCIGSVLFLFVSRLIAIAVLLGSVFQLRAN